MGVLSYDEDSEICIRGFGTPGFTLNNLLRICEDFVYLTTEACLEESSSFLFALSICIDMKAVGFLQVGQYSEQYQ